MTAEDMTQEPQEIKLTASLQEELEKLRAEEKPPTEAEKYKQLEAQRNTLKAIVQNINRELGSATIEETPALILRLNQQAENLANVACFGIEGKSLREYLEIEPLHVEKIRREGKPIGIPLDIYFYGTDKTIVSDKTTEEKVLREQLLLPSGAITYVCAPTSHGKTLILENFALQTLQQEGEGSVLFFSVEEDKDAIKDSFFNIYMNTALNAKEPNFTTIGKYMNESDPMKQAGLFPNAETFSTFQAKELEFYRKYIENGNLRIIYEESRSVDKIQEVARYIRETLQDEDPTTHPIKAVFIDYIQRLKKSGNFNGNSKAQLAEITNDLMTLSIELQVPFVVAVQFNRQVHSPIEMELKNIGEASEIEFSGNKVILCWNSSEPASQYSTEWRTKKKDKDTQEETIELSKSAKDFEKRTGISVGQGGKIYAILAKNRKGRKNIECVFDINGNTGRMTQNQTEHKLVEAWKDQIAKTEIQNSLTGGGIEKHDYIDPNGSGEPATKRPHTSKSFSQMRQEAQAQKKAEQQAQKEAEKTAQAEAPADTEDAGQPQQEVTITDLKADLDRRIEQMEAKQDETATPSEPETPEDPNNAIGTAEVEAPPF